MFSNTMSFSAMVQDRYYRISHHIGQLIIDDVKIDLPYDICSLSLSPDRVYVVYSGIRHDGFRVMKDIPLNNVAAYDFTGRCVWQIANVWSQAEAVRPAMRPGLHFCQVEWHTAATYAQRVSREGTLNALTGVPFAPVDGHEYLVCESIYGERFTLDLTVQDVVCITSC